MRAAARTEAESASRARARTNDRVSFIWKEPSNWRGCGPVSAILHWGKDGQRSFRKKSSRPWNGKYSAVEHVAVPPGGILWPGGL